MGLGRFGGGASVARWFAERGDEVLATDLRSKAQLDAAVAELEPLGVHFRLERHDPADFDRADVLVVNPAVPFDNELVKRAEANGARIVTEMGLTLRELEGPVVAITGTNGKSTTAALCAAMLEHSGVPVRLGGNIGCSLLNEASRLGSETVAVLEISSFQLAWLEHDAFAPRVGVVTNVSGDHFDRHVTLEHYVESKRRLVTAVPEDGLVVLRADDPVCRNFADAARGRVVWFGGAHRAPHPVDALRLPGRHNRENAAAAMLASLEVGATAAGCAAALADFRPLPHRLERVGEIREGVECIDDSVSTTPEATAAAVRSFCRPVVLLTGGRDKGLHLSPLLEAAQEARQVVCYGESGPGLSKALPGTHLRPDFDSAVRLAFDLARPGDIVLLSPGFASYDEFPGFDARGERFRALVEEGGL
jgi:UDP-N-acetylmuramoylalanine--D-glutamate ligase